MGVYVFKSRHADVIKVGHYIGRDAWARVANRGFNSCICPFDIREKVAAEDLELLAWFPSLKPADERNAHTAFEQFCVCGEWLSAECAPDVVAYLAMRGGENRAGACDLISARQSLNAGTGRGSGRAARGRRGRYASGRGASATASCLFVDDTPA